MISQATVEKFRAVVKEEFGTEMSVREATDAIHGLVNYFDLLARIDQEINDDEYERISEQALRQ